MEMEAAHHEHQVMLMRQDLMRHQEEQGRWRSCITKRFRNENRIQAEEEHRHCEKEMQHQEDVMRRQQEGFKRTFPDAREQEIRMDQMAMGGAMCLENTDAMPAPVTPGTPAPSGLATTMPDGTLGLTPPTTEHFGQGATMEEIGAIGGTPPTVKHPAPGTEFAPNKHLRYYTKLHCLVSCSP